MKGSIRVEYDFADRNSYLQLKVSHDSEDLRDQMLSDFLQRLSNSDQTVYVAHPEHSNTEFGIANICISQNPPEYAVNKRVDDMKSWAKQFFEDSEMQKFNEFFNVLSVKASLKSK